MKLADLLDLNQLEKDIEAGYVSVRTHPDDPEYQIYNYTPKTQYERYWNDVTRQTRGLIVTHGRVQQRPWSKFFNYGEGETIVDPDAPAQVTDKMDGSLGILYADPERRPAIATRGSFTSEQALFATRLIRTRYSDFKAAPYFTYLFEILYPQNRIVLDYGDTEDLVLLGAVNVLTGEVHGPEFDPVWPGPRAEVFAAKTLAEALELPNRQNAEGLVIRYSNGSMLKVKQSDYVELHKIVTGLNKISVWETMRANNGQLDSLLSQLPDEFHAWVREEAAKIWDDYMEILLAAAGQYITILMDEMPDGFERKDFAFAVQEIKDPVVRRMMFPLLDGKDPQEIIWKHIRPNMALDADV